MKRTSPLYNVWYSTFEGRYVHMNVYGGEKAANMAWKLRIEKYTNIKILLYGIDVTTELLKKGA